MSILSELKKLTGKQNAKVVSEALPDSTGSGNFVVTITYEGKTPVADKTYSEVSEAIEAGKSVIAKIVSELGSVGYVQFLRKTAGGVIIFGDFFVDGNSVAFSQLTISEYEVTNTSMILTQ